MQARQRVLEDHRDLAPADRFELVLGHREQVLAVEECVPGHLRAGAQAHDRLGGDRLARPRLTHDAEGLARLDGEGHALDGVDGAVVGVEGDPRSTHLEQRHVRLLGTGSTVRSVDAKLRTRRRDRRPGRLRRVGIYFFQRLVGSTYPMNAVVRGSLDVGAR